MSRDQALGCRWAALTLGFLTIGCEANTEALNELSPLDAGGGHDAAPRDSGTPSGEDAGAIPTPIRCTTPNPAGCGVNACPPNAICDHNLGCAPSSCSCGPDGNWDCTDDCGGGTCRPTDLIFRLRYDSDVEDQTVWAQSGGGQPWVTVIDSFGNNVFIDADCGQCSCDSCGNCPLCGFAPAAVTQFGGVFGPMERTWDLTTHPPGRCASSPGSNIACQEYLPLAPGRYIARFCFGYRTVETREGHFVEQPVCNEVGFEWPTTNNVVEYYHCDCG